MKRVMPFLFVLMLLTACYAEPSAGNNQPPAKCAVRDIQIVPVEAPQVYHYTVFAELQSDECFPLTVEEGWNMNVNRAVVHSRPLVHGVFSDGPAGLIIDTSPYAATTDVPRRVPHNIFLAVGANLTAKMIDDFDIGWLECRIERDGVIVNDPGQTGSARVAITGPGHYEVVCVIDVPVG